MAPETDPTTRRLEVAVGAAVAEVLVQAALLVAGGALGGAPLRVVFLSAKLPFAWLTLRRRPGAYLGLWLYEIAAVIAAIGAPGAAGTRVAFVLGAVVVMVLLGRAVCAFPPVEWRSR